MKRRHFLLGMSAVLVLSVAIPAFGSQVLRPSGKNTVAVAKKALKEAQHALDEVKAAAALAGEVQDGANKATSAAAGASVASNEAKTQASSAQQAANRAQQTAGIAQQSADGAKLEAQSGLSAAANALQVANSKFGHFVVTPPATDTAAANRKLTVDATCDGRGTLVGGGYRLPKRGTVLESDPNGNAWSVEAENGGGELELLVFAVCAKP